MKFSVTRTMLKILQILLHNCYKLICIIGFKFCVIVKVIAPCSTNFNVREES